MYISIINNNFPVIKTFSGNTIYNIHDIYKIDERSNEVEVRKYAEWKSSMGLEVIEQNIWKRRSDLRGNHLRYIVKKIEIRIIGKQTILLLLVFIH